MMSDPWQPVALAAQLRPGSIQPIRLNGQNLVLWRAETGEIAAWEDRCPHRGMKLSFGAVQGASLLCPYHGWTFGTDGQCQHVPAHPEVKPSRAMRPVTYMAAEAQGFIWISLARDGGTFQPLPELDGLTLAPIRTLHIPTAAERVAEQLRLAGFPPAAGLARGEIEGSGFVVLLQVCDDESCALHIAGAAPISTEDALRINSAFTLFRLKLLEGTTP